jgi:DNA-binding transcriptional ArsR family regulator
MQGYHKELKKRNLEASKEVSAILDTLSTSVSVKLFEDLRNIFKKYYLDSLVVNYAVKHPEAAPKELIYKLSEIGPDGFYDAYVKEAIKPLGMDEASVKSRIEEVLDNNTSQFIMNYTQLKKFKAESKNVFQNFIDTLNAFADIYDKIAHRVEEIYEREIKNFHDDMHDEDKFRNSFLMIQFDGATDMVKSIDVCVTIIPEFYLMYIVSEDHAKLTLVVGFGMRKYAYDQEATLAQEIFKALGDPTKLLMIQLAAKEPYCAKDFSDRFELSKATISHHISILISLKLFTLNLQEGKKMYYSTNKELIKRLFENFMNDLSK